MARFPRIRIKGAYYHIICRSLSEFNLFRDDYDKQKYLDILSKTTQELSTTLVAFCLMSSHIHFIMNPNSINISYFMKKVNCSYAKYYNSKYARHGPVFADRFKSKIINSLAYLLTAICYIHYNPLDLGYLTNTLKDYPYSSFKYYQSPSIDNIYHLDKGILRHYLNNSKASFLKLHQLYAAYHKPGIRNKFIEDDCFFDGRLTPFTKNPSPDESYLYVTGTHYLSKTVSPLKVLNRISRHFSLEGITIFSKNYHHAFHDLRCISTVLLRSICGITYREIASIFGDISLSNIYWLNKKGNELFKSTYNKEQLLQLIFS
ncbi:MAG: transposase [Vallitaleaceae bacterium]|jgi:putative transposase|nr:transposase [Vallitaleaceae bacterium]